MHFYGSPVLKPEAKTSLGVDQQTAISLLEHVKAYLTSVQVNFREVLMRGGKKYGEYDGIHCCLDTRRFNQADAEVLRAETEEDIVCLLGECRELISVQVQASGHPFTIATPVATEEATEGETAS